MQDWIELTYSFAHDLFKCKIKPRFIQKQIVSLSKMLFSGLIQVVSDGKVV